MQDHTTCFRCGVSLKDWEHAKYSLRYIYVIYINGIGVVLKNAKALKTTRELFRVKEMWFVLKTKVSPVQISCKHR